MPKPRPIRIALVHFMTNEYVHRLLFGMSRVTHARKNRIHIKSLELVEGTLPDSFHHWKPDAVVAYVEPENTHVLDQISSCGRPVVHTINMPARESEAVVLGDAWSIYDAAWTHFESLNLSNVVQFVSGNQASERSCFDRYRAYCKARNRPWSAFVLENEHDEVYTANVPRHHSTEMCNWLRGLTSPVGIFTQQDFAGPYLCRVCEQLRIAVPDQVAIIGTCDFDVSFWCRPALTSVRLSAEMIGERAVTTALKMIRGAAAPTDHVRIQGAEVIPRGSTPDPGSERISIPDAVKFIDQNACYGITVNDVVKHTQRVSRPTFQRAFTTWTGKSPGDYIREKKLQEALRLLADTELSVTRIAQMCGYSEDIVFRKVFRKAQKMSPTDYRKNTR